MRPALGSHQSIVDREAVKSYAKRRKRKQMALSRKHFKAAAEMIAEEPSKEAAEFAAQIVIRMNDNPNFDRQRFYEAAGLDENGKRQGGR